jgi:DNA-directed RNA polymerase subunit N (RpoN/RPB10)
MINNDFKPINCSRCGTVVWQGISWAGFAKKLDTPVLSIEEEIIKRLSGLMTYECHRTMVSFEAVERSLNRIKFSKRRNTVILADHICGEFKLFATQAPDYWQIPLTVLSTSQEAAF